MCDTALSCATLSNVLIKVKRNLCAGVNRYIYYTVKMIASSSPPAMPGPGLSNQCTTWITVSILTRKNIFFSDRERQVSE